MTMSNSKRSPQIDAYLKPSFSTGNKVKRLIWNLVWLFCCRWTPNPMHGWRIFILRLFGARIGRNNAVYPTSKIWAPWLLQTDNVATIGPGVEIYNPGGVRLGHHAILSQDSYLCGATHDYDSIEFTYIKKEIVVEDYGWICARAIVLPGVVCKEGSVLGAGSVTSKDLEAWMVYAGNPAKLIKPRRKFLRPD
jgi:putative colanic acid biosynthesis acetyltransferase WcaF